MARPMHSSFIRLAAELSYPRIDDLKTLSLNDDVYQKAIQASALTNNLIFFFPGETIALTEYGYKLSLFGLGTGGSNNYFLRSPDLNVEFLRDLLNGIDFLTYKICHIYKEGQRKSYTDLTEKLYDKSRNMKGIVKVADWDDYVDKFDKVRHVRNAFAHSFIDIEHIIFDGVELQYCFGHIANGAPRLAKTRNGFLFMDVAAEVLSPLYDAFIARQIEQINGAILYAEADKLLS